jgi:hypothetical protein
MSEKEKQETEEHKKEIKDGIKLDNLDVESYTKNILKEIETSLDSKETIPTIITEEDLKEYLRELTIKYIQALEEKVEEIKKIAEAIKKAKDPKKIKMLERKRKILEKGPRFFHYQLLKNRLLERLGIEVAMRFERYYGREPIDKSYDKLGFDIISNDRFIEVKTLIKGKPTFTEAEDKFIRVEELVLANGTLEKVLNGELKIEDFKKIVTNESQKYSQELKKRWIYEIRINKEALMKNIYSHTITLYEISSYEILKALDYNPAFFIGTLNKIYPLYIQKFNPKPLKIIPSEQIINMLSIFRRIMIYT